MVVIPVDSQTQPSKVFVVELAEPIRGSDGTTRGQGVLIYSVDATLESGRNPIVTYPKSREKSSVYSFLYKAPFQAGDSFEHDFAPFKLGVLEQEGQNYRIRIFKE